MSCLNDGRHKGEYLPKGRKEMKNMKKNIFKKIVASLATVAMAAGLFTAMPAEEVKAADVGGDKAVYIVGSDTTWTPADAPKMITTDGQTFTYEFTVAKAKKIEFKLLVGKTDWSAQRNAKDKSVVLTNIAGGDNFEIECGNVGKVTITAVFEGATLKSIKAAGSALGEVKALDVYTVKGTLPGMDWNPKGDVGLMTEKDGVFSLSFKDVAANEYKIKVVQDGANFEWANQFTSDDLEKDGDGNNVLKLEKKSDVTVSINKDTKKVTITATEVQESSGGNTEDGKTEDGKTEDGKTEDGKTEDGKTEDGKTEDGKTEEKGVTVEVTLDPSIKWEEVYIHAWGEGFETKWPGVKMTAKDGKWYATLDTKLAELSFVINAGNGKEQTANIEKVSTKNAKITVTAEKNEKGHFVASAGTVAGGGSAKPGDSAPVAIMLAVAAVAAGMVVASKKKTICE